MIYPVDPGFCRKFISEARLYRYLTDGRPLGCILVTAHKENCDWWWDNLSKVQITNTRELGRKSFIKHNSYTLFLNFLFSWVFRGSHEYLNWLLSELREFVPRSGQPCRNVKVGWWQIGLIARLYTFQDVLNSIPLQGLKENNKVSEENKHCYLVWNIDTSILMFTMWIFLPLPL